MKCLQIVNRCAWKQRMASSVSPIVPTHETMFRIVQSVPSPKAEPIKHWLATVGMERLEEMENPAWRLIAHANTISRVAIARSGSRSGCAAS